MAFTNLDRSYPRYVVDRKTNAIYKLTSKGLGKAVTEGNGVEIGDIINSEDDTEPFIGSFLKDRFTVAA